MQCVNFENFPSGPNMGASTGVTAYVKTQSLPKNGSHQKWLHEALTTVYTYPEINEALRCCLLCLLSTMLLQMCVTQQE